MAITRTAKGTAQSKTSGTTLTIASVAMTTGHLLVVSLAYDDQTLDSVTWGSETLTLGDSVIGGGVRTRLAWKTITTGGTQTITATWSAALTAKAMVASSYSSSGGGSPQVDSNATNTGSGTAASTAAVSPAIVGGTESILVGVVGTEGPNGDTAGTWSTPSTNGQRLGTTGNPTHSNVTVSEGYQLAPSAGSTPALSKTGMTNRDWGAGIRAFYWGSPPTQNISLALIDQTAATFAPTISQAGPQSYTPALIDQTAVAFAPTISQPGAGISLDSDGLVAYSAGAAATHNIPFVLAADVGKNVTIELICAADRTVSSISDTAGNTWVLSHRQNSGTSLTVWIYSARVTTAITTSHTLDVTLSASQGLGATGQIWSGGEVTWADVASGGDSAGVGVTTFDSGVTGTTAQADELYLSVLGLTATSGGITPDQSGLTALTTATPTDFVRTAYPYYKILTATGTQQFSGSYTTTRQNAAIVATFKAAATGGSTISLGLINQAAAPFAPTITAGAVNVSLGLIDRTAATFTPTVTATRNLTIGLLSQTAVAHAPTVTSTRNVSLALLNQAATASTPTVTAQASISLALLNQTAAPSAPTISVGAAPITIGLINQAAAPFTPTVSTTAAVSVALIDQSATTFAPSVGQGISLDLINQAAVTFAPTVTSLATIAVGLINQAATPFAPSVGMHISFADETDTFTRSVTDGWGGKWVKNSGVDSEFQVDGSAGQIIPSTFGTEHRQRLAVTAGDVDVRVRIRTDKLASGGSQQAMVHGRWGVANSHYYRVTVIFNTNQTIQIRLDKNDGSGFAAIAGATANVPFVETHAANQWYKVRFQVTGTTIRAKLWQDGFAEPGSWGLETTHSGVTAGGAVTLGAWLDPSTSNSPVTVEFDDLTVSHGRIDQTASTFTPTVSSLNTISLGLINQAAATFNPTVSTGASQVTIGIIDQTAATFAPTVSVGAVNVSLDLISQAAVAYAPTVTSLATVSLALIDQTATAQTPDIGRAISVDLIDQTAQAHEPTVASFATVSLALIDQTAAPFDPTISAGAAPITIGTINQTAATFTPTVTSLAMIDAGFVDQTALAYGPALSNLNTVSLGIIDQTAATFDLTLTQGTADISPALIDQTAVAFTPTVSSLASVSLDLIDQTAAVFTPAVANLNTISLALIDETAITYDPVVSTGAAPITIGTINQTAATFTPTVSTTASVSLALIDQTATASEPTVSTLTIVSIGLINQLAATFNPAVSTAATITLDLLDQSAAASDPTVTSSVDVSPGLIDQTAVAYDPTITNGGVLVSLDLIDQAAVAYGLALLNAPEWTTPADGASMSATPELKFLVPVMPDDMHFNIQIDTAPTFDSVDLRDVRSDQDQTGWDFWNGSGWEPVPVGGVSPSFAGNEARYTVQTPLSATSTWHRRVRAGS